ncbi:GLPGLI family protein [Alloprevotella tannerae]|uniref:GLPGLI family protein n=1 Tax=Alloprevotella tannerae TaxID=76122 RepID=UPI0028D5F0B8|nr:GLPGLI family protein [Alloprevotella tannerae]
MQTLTLTCRIKIVCCLLLFALSAMGQKQKAMRITYKVVYTYSSDLAPRHDVSYLDVQDDGVSCFYSHYFVKSQEIQDSINRRGSVSIDMMSKAIAPYDGGQPDFVYKHIPAEGKLTFATYHVDWFKYSEAIPALQWKIEGKDSVIAGYHCQAATTSLRGRRWRAWFTLDIPVSDGPWKLCGLPGLILRATDEQGYFDFDCTGIASIEIPPIELAKNNYVSCTPEEAFKMEQERRENPLAFLNRQFGGQQQFPDELVRKADQRNNEEAKKKFTYIERYD